jgi:hypothetical protein
MNTTITHFFVQPIRVVTLIALAGLCLIGWSAQAARLAPSNPAPTAAANKVTSPMHPPAPAAASADQDIRDIRPPYHIPAGWLWIAWTAGGLASALLGYGAWRWRHRLGIRVKLPYELALEQLEEARRLMQPEQARAFSIAVSEIVRDYIEKCFPVRAAHRTTEEFLRDLATRPNSPLIAHQLVLADFLNHCDLAKFARWILPMPQMEAMLRSAGTFIVATGRPIVDVLPAHPVGISPPPPSPGAPMGAPVSIPCSHGDRLSVASENS